MKKLILIFILSSVFYAVSAQKNKEKDYIVKPNNDTIYGDVKVLSETPWGGVSFNFEPEKGDKFKCSRDNIIAFAKVKKKETWVFRLKTLDPSKPDGKKNFCCILSKGKAILYLEGYPMAGGAGGFDAGGFSGGSAKPRYYFQFDNGEFIKVNKSSFSKKVAPYLTSCDGFNSANKKKVKLKNIEDLVKVFNENCGN